MSFGGDAVLVTGGAGFIGSHLVEKLVAQGAQVTVVDNLSSGRLANLQAVGEKIRFERLDLPGHSLDDLLGDSGFEVVFHLAGHVDIPASVRAPEWDLEVNGLSTLRLVDGIRRVSPGSRLVFASSAAVYGEGEGRPLRETDPASPIAPYGVSKLMGEHYLRVYAESHDLRTASLRLFPVYGPRLRKHVVHDFIAKLQRNPEALEIHGDGEQVRDFLFVDDAVDAFLLVASTAPSKGECFNVASGRQMSIAELGRAVAAAMGLQPRFVFSGISAPGVSQSWTADLARIRVLGFDPKVGLAEGLAMTVAASRA